MTTKLTTNLPRTISGTFLQNGLEALGFTEDDAAESVRAIEDETAATITTGAIEDAVNSLVLVFRNYCRERFGYSPTEDEFRLMMRQATLIADSDNGPDQ